MTALEPVTARVWAWLAGFAVVLVIVVGSLWLAYDHGRVIEKAEWDAKWATRDLSDSTARLAATDAERAKERAHQKAIDQVQQNAEQQIDTALTHAADAALAADGLRSQVNKLLAADRARRAACATAGSPAVENPGNLLAVVLDKSVARNRELAAIADTARIAGLACEAAYGALRGVP